MDALAELLGIESQELIRLLVLAGVLLVGLVSMRIFLKLAMSAVRLGCFISLLAVAGYFVLSLLN